MNKLKLLILGSLIVWPSWVLCIFSMLGKINASSVILRHHLYTCRICLFVFADNTASLSDWESWVHAYVSNELMLSINIDVDHLSVSDL